MLKAPRREWKLVKGLYTLGQIKGLRKTFNKLMMYNKRSVKK